jgi:hypothetical protein
MGTLQKSLNINCPLGRSVWVVKYKNTWTPNQSTSFFMSLDIFFISWNTNDRGKLNSNIEHMLEQFWSRHPSLIHEMWSLLRWNSCKQTRNVLVIEPGIRKYRRSIKWYFNKIQFTLFSSENEIKNVYICPRWNIKIHEPKINQPAFLCLWISFLFREIPMIVEIQNK